MYYTIFHATNPTDSTFCADLVANGNRFDVIFFNHQMHRIVSRQHLDEYEHAERIFKRFCDMHGFSNVVDVQNSDTPLYY